MKRIIFIVLIIFAFISCNKETVSNQSDTDLPGFWRYQSGVPWQLLNPDDGNNPVAYIDLDEEGMISGFSSRNFFEGTYTSNKAGAFRANVDLTTLGPDTEWSGHFFDMIRGVDQYTIKENQLTLSYLEAPGDYIFIKLDDDTCHPAKNDQDLFDNGITDEFKLIEVNVFGTCLEARIEYSGGCVGIDVEMVGSGDYGNGIVPQLAVRFIVDDDDPCEALVYENFYFDVTDLLISGLDRLQLNIEGLDDPVIIVY